MDQKSVIARCQAVFRHARWPHWSFLSTIIGLLTYGIWRRTVPSATRKRLKSAEDSDPSLLRKHSTFERYTTTSGYIYPRIRTFYKEHQQAGQLPADLPLLVFIHGLGGSASQFVPLLTSLINQAPCLAIDLPGSGRSDFLPADRDAYSIQALAELLAAVIHHYRDAENDQKVILVGHSMGCSIAALLASSTSPLSRLLEGLVIGMIALCPRGAAPTVKETKQVNLFTSIPIFLFDVLRFWDRRGGLKSSSVVRMTGEGADEETRKLQLRYNAQSQSEPFLHIMRASAGPRGMPGRDVWSGIKVPLFLVAGESDGITPRGEVDLISAWLTSTKQSGQPDASIETMGEPPLPSTTGDTSAAEQIIQPQKSQTMPPRTKSGTVIEDEHSSTKHSVALKTTVFPTPASHGLMYDTRTVRILSGMIESFLSEHIDERLGMGWQLHTLTTSGKWDVKNLKKWQGVDACSEPMGGIFRAMKTMREVDDVHNPREFVKRYSYKVIPNGVAAVVDISHESPVYHPAGLEDAGVEYHKFPTVSKERPKEEETDHFIELVDKLLQEPKFQPSEDGKTRPVIAIHCHYGFNRTGWFIICYLVERKGYKLQDAIDEFAQKRPPGIKHDHFLNGLYVRYAVNMQRRPTLTVDE